MNDSSFCDVKELLDYWAEEPPPHVLLALRYLGQGKRRGGRQNEEDLRKDLGEVAHMMGTAPQPLPAHLKAMIQQVEQVKKEHKGLNGR